MIASSVKVWYKLDVLSEKEDLGKRRWILQGLSTNSVRVYEVRCYTGTAAGCAKTE